MLPGVFTLRDRACGVLANESQAQWCSDRTQGPLGAPYREAEAGDAVSGSDKGRQTTLSGETKCSS